MTTRGVRMWGCLSLHARSHANRVLRFHAAPDQGERQQRPDDWRADHDEREDGTKSEARRMAGFAFWHCQRSVVVCRIRTCIRIAGHARFVRAGCRFRCRPGDILSIARCRLCIARIAAGMRVGSWRVRPVTLAHLSSPVRTRRRGSPTACSRPVKPRFPSPPSHPLPASASSESAAGNRRPR